jgi:ribosomal protein S18 acetylase RimI-like enzyme
MTATAAGADRNVARGLRPLDPARDLGTIARLIADAFADEIDERGRAALREMRWMARLSPLVWWWSRADPSFSDTFNGYVWQEPSPVDRSSLIVGNVSLNRAPGSANRWVISNVVVLDEYRGQGIGRQLIEAATAEAWDLGAREIVLQVYQGNLPALRLYSDLGFREAGGETEFRLGAATPGAPSEAPGYRLRAWRASDGKATYELARSATSEALQWLKPIRPDAYQPDWLLRAGSRFADLLAGRRLHRVVALKDNKPVALSTVTVALRGGHHQMALLVHPDHAGCIEALLVSRALYALAAGPPRMITITIDKAQTAAIEVLRSHGFQEYRTLITLRKRSGQS